MTLMVTTTKKEYVVFWTFLGNYSDNPIRIHASDYIEAAEKATPYDPYAKYGKYRMSFFIFEVGNDLVHAGPLERK